MHFNVLQKMKRTILALLIGILLGFVGTWLALPKLERARERSIVRQAVTDFDLPSLPSDATVTYAYHNDQFVLEWYGFEFRTTADQAKQWKVDADTRDSEQKLGDGHVDFDCVLRNGYYVEVRLFESHK
jgi:hypothetical protein